MTTDPVCGKEIDARNAISETFEGHEFSFCSQKCKDEFNRHPDRYAAEGMRAGIRYPMGISS
jgi:YHS domain-containing protein